MAVVDNNGFGIMRHAQTGDQGASYSTAAQKNSGFHLRAFIGELSFEGFLFEFLAHTVRGLQQDFYVMLGMRHTNDPVQSVGGRHVDAAFQQQMYKTRVPYLV